MTVAADRICANVTGATPLGPLQDQLRALSGVVQTLDSRMFRATPRRTSGSVGAHVRHCIDHARALLASVGAGPMTYDARVRGTALETDPVHAVAALDAVCADMERLAGRSLDEPIRLAVVVRRGGAPVVLDTTLGREIAYVHQHTVHHCALIGMLLETQRARVPDGFGLAPSTPAPN
jgi:hypothetical protein